MTAAAALCSATFVTGKTDESQVIDVYEGAAELNLAQNSIASALQTVGNDVINDTKKGIMAMLDGDKFVKDMTELNKKVTEAGANPKDIKNILKEYKNGALAGIIDSSGIKDIIKMGKDIGDGVANGVKDLAFGSVKGFVDSLVPGVLDGAGIKNFKDAKKLYDKISDELENGNLTELILNDKTIMLAANNFVVDKSLEIIDAILGPELKIGKSKNADLDTAILASASKGVINIDNIDLNKHLLDSLPTNEKKEAFVASTVNIAAMSGSANFLEQAAEATSESFVRNNVNIKPSEFLGNIKVPATLSNEEYQAYGSSVAKGVEILTGKTGAAVPIETFAHSSKQAADLLTRNELYAEQQAIAKDMSARSKVKNQNADKDKWGGDFADPSTDGRGANAWGGDFADPSTDGRGADAWGGDFADSATDGGGADKWGGDFADDYTQDPWDSVIIR